MFVEDIFVPSMLYALLLRSPANQGYLERIISPELPEDYTLITAKDIPGDNELDDFPVPILASENLSYIGEPVALLLGPDLIVLENLAAQCVVKVIESDSKSKAQSEDEYFLKIHCNHEARKMETTENTAYLPRLIVDGSYATGIQEHWYTEPHGALAYFTEGKLFLHTASQWPFHIKRSLSKTLKIDDSLIEITSVDIGFHLDGKLWYPTLISCQAALGAYITGKPVKIMLTRTDDFRWSPKRNSVEFHFASILGEKNELLGTEIHVAANLGSQGVFSGEILSQTCLASMGVYYLGEVNLEGLALKTKLPPQGPFEGFGMSQGFFASERHVSRIADSLGQDPADWRKNNCIRKNDKLAIGIPLKENVPMTELIDSVAAMSDYYRKWASCELLRNNRRTKNLENIDLRHESRRGIGIAVAFQGNGTLFFGDDRGVYGVELSLGKDGILDIKSSIIPREAKIWRDLAGSILGIEENNINIVHSGRVPDSGPACLSRSISRTTRIVERCCDTIRKMRFRNPLPITVRRYQRPDRFTPWNGQNGEASADASAFANPAWGAAVTEIEIDLISLKPVVRGIWLMIEGGKILSETKAQRSLKLSAIHALNWSCREEVIYDNGIIHDDIIRSYGLPVLEEAPPIRISFLPNDSTIPKGIGELPYSCIPAAYVQAVSQAMDYPFEKIPLSARDVWEAEKSKKAVSPS